MLSLILVRNGLSFGKVEAATTVVTPHWCKPYKLEIPILEAMQV
jgi:hypothetical protein